MKDKTTKVLREIEELCVLSFNKEYPAWISNSLTTIELTLKETLEEIKKVEVK